MRLHVLAGCRDLLYPDILSPEAVADLISPGVMAARAYWLSPNAGDRYHTFLQDNAGDRRVSVLAEALYDGFGTRNEPLLVLADLLDESRHYDEPDSPEVAEGRRTQRAVVAEILEAGHVQELCIYGVALPSKSDPDDAWAVPAGLVPGIVRERIESLREGLGGDFDADAIVTRVIETTPDIPLFNKLLNNGVSNQLARHLQPRLREHGWETDLPALAQAVSDVLTTLNSRGLYAAVPLRPAHFAEMAELVLKRLLSS